MYFSTRSEAETYYTITDPLLKKAEQHFSEARHALAPLMKYKKQLLSEPLELDLQDLIDSRKWVIVRKEGMKMMVDEYRKKVEGED